MNLVLTGGPLPGGRPPSFYFYWLVRLVVVGAVSLALTNVAHGQTTHLLYETFSSVTEPALPASVTASNTTWKTSTSSESPGSGGNNIVHTGTSEGSIVLGPIDLSGRDSASLAYFARRTSSYPADSLVIRFSLDGGSTFPHVVATGGLPAAASAYEYVVLALSAPLLGESNVFLQFDGRGGSSSGSNFRLDDISITVPLSPNDTPTSFGFSTPETTWNPSSENLNLALGLSFTGPDSIQGLQFELQTEASFLEIGSMVLTEPFFSDPSWQLTQNGNKTVAISTSGAAIPPGEYPSFLSIPVQYSGPALEADSTITLNIEDFLAASSSASGSLTGNEVVFALGERSHQLTIQASPASIAVSSDSLGFAPVTVGDSLSLTLTLSNPTGQTDLVIDSVRFDPAHPPSVFRVQPETAFVQTPIPPGTTLDVPIWFEPDLASYGWLESQITLFHNAPGDSTVVLLTGTGLGGRGDTDLDGELDVADVIWALDIVSGLITITPSQAAPYDLYPFPSGDGAIDVRDLTVQIQSILRNEWPDGSRLPTAPAMANPTGKSSNRFEVAQTSLILDTIEPIRGLQITLRTNSSIPNTFLAKSNASTHAYYDPASNTYRSLVTFQPNSELAPGRHTLLDQLPHGTTFLEGILVTSSKEKQRIYSLDGFQTVTESVPPGRLAEPQVYPNPFSRSRHQTLTLKHAPQGAQTVEIFNLLGRETTTISLAPRSSASSATVTLDKNQLPQVPGLHFLRITTKTGTSTLPLTILH